MIRRIREFPWAAFNDGVGLSPCIKFVQRDPRPCLCHNGMTSAGKPDCRYALSCESAREEAPCFRWRKQYRKVRRPVPPAQDSFFKRGARIRCFRGELRREPRSRGLRARASQPRLSADPPVLCESRATGKSGLSERSASRITCPISNQCPDASSDVPLLAAGYQADQATGRSPSFCRFGRDPSWTMPLR